MSRKPSLPTVALLLALLLAVAPPTAAQDPIEAFAAPGPYPTESDGATGPDDDFTVYHPADPGGDGSLLPVLAWGNGTFALPSFYDGLLDHLASWGFIVIGPNDFFVGDGSEMLRGIDFILAENENPDSIFFQAVATDLIGATGHSQGGEGAINVANDPRVVCSSPIQPVPGDVPGVQGPMFVLTGSDDIIVPPGGVYRNVYLPSPVATVLGGLVGGDHLDPLGDGDGYRGYLTAWFRACLWGDEQAADAFSGPCELCGNAQWRELRKGGS